MSDITNLHIYGLCPVQAEGEVDGHPFYFRSRHNEWSFRIVNNPADDPVRVPENAEGWHKEQEWGEELEDAGYMPEEEVQRIIEACATEWDTWRKRNES